jgi:hypothetical protein
MNDAQLLRYFGKNLVYFENKDRLWRWMLRTVFFEMPQLVNRYFDKLMNPNYVPKKKKRAKINMTLNPPQCQVMLTTTTSTLPTTTTTTTKTLPPVISLISPISKTLPPVVCELTGQVLKDGPDEEENQRVTAATSQLMPPCLHLPPPIFRPLSPPQNPIFSSTLPQVQVVQATQDLQNDIKGAIIEIMGTTPERRRLHLNTQMNPIAGLATSIETPLNDSMINSQSQTLTTMNPELNVPLHNETIPTSESNRDATIFLQETPIAARVLIPVTNPRIHTASIMNPYTSSKKMIAQTLPPLPQSDITTRTMTTHTSGERTMSHSMTQVQSVRTYETEGISEMTQTDHLVDQRIIPTTSGNTSNTSVVIPPVRSQEHLQESNMAKLLGDRAIQQLGIQYSKQLVQQVLALPPKQPQTVLTPPLGLPPPLQHMTNAPPLKKAPPTAPPKAPPKAPPATKATPVASRSTTNLKRTRANSLKHTEPTTATTESKAAKPKAKTQETIRLDKKRKSPYTKNQQKAIDQTMKTRANLKTPMTSDPEATPDEDTTPSEASSVDQRKKPRHQRAQQSIPPRNQQNQPTQTQPRPTSTITTPKPPPAVSTNAVSTTTANVASADSTTAQVDQPMSEQHISLTKNQRARQRMKVKQQHWKEIAKNTIAANSMAKPDQTTIESNQVTEGTPNTTEKKIAAPKKTSPKKKNPKKPTHRYSIGPINSKRLGRQGQKGSKRNEEGKHNDTSNQTPTK